MKHTWLLAVAVAAVGCDSSEEVSTQTYAVKHDKRSCATRDLSDAQQDKVDADLLTPAAFTTGAIDVYVHVIKNSAGQGGVTANMIDAQVDVLNDAYAAAGFTFTLQGVTSTTNDAWY